MDCCDKSRCAQVPAKSKDVLWKSIMQSIPSRVFDHGKYLHLSLNKEARCGIQLQIAGPGISMLPHNLGYLCGNIFFKLFEVLLEIIRQFGGPLFVSRFVNYRSARIENL